MLLKFDNPQNGRFYMMFAHFDEYGAPQLTIVRGGKHCPRRVENLTFSDPTMLEKEIEKRVKKRLKRGYLQNDT